IALAADQGQRVDTLRFDAGGRAELRLPPGVYRYAASEGEGAERGVVAVDAYTDEWRPAVPVVTPHAGTPGGWLTGVALRDRWWVFAVAILGARLARAGRAGLLAAAYTFRAGAAEQLLVWADRLGVPCVTGTNDPAAIAFDAIAAARARGVDTVLVDTAGRLHTEARLLAELKKVVRVVAKQQPGAPHESLLVLDATVGQNAVHQARAFAAAVPLTGLIVTKLDGTAKGGSVVALERAVQVPIRFLGTGEGLGDLEVFAAERFARRLIGG